MSKFSTIAKEDSISSREHQHEEVLAALGSDIKEIEEMVDQIDPPDHLAKARNYQDQRK